MERVELLNFRVGVEKDGTLVCDVVVTNLLNIMLKDLKVTKEQKETLDKEIKNTYEALYKIGALLDDFIPSNEEIESEEA